MRLRLPLRSPMRDCFARRWYNNATNPAATRCEYCNGPAQDPGTAHGTDYCSSTLVARCAQ